MPVSTEARWGTLVGVITTWRREVRPFSQRQVELVKTFAAQAVIAIQTARLFNEAQRASAAAEAANEAKSAFLANMSHVRQQGDDAQATAVASDEEGGVLQRSNIHIAVCGSGAMLPCCVTVALGLQTVR